MRWVSVFPAEMQAVMRCFDADRVALGTVIDALLHPFRGLVRAGVWHSLSPGKCWVSGLVRPYGLVVGAFRRHKAYLDDQRGPTSLAESADALRAVRRSCSATRDEFPRLGE